MGTAASWTALFARRRGSILGVAWLLSLALQLSAFHAVRADDAYITYRYGQNLAEGVGLVFNPDQRVQGSTSPAHMLLSALVYAVFGLTATPGWMAAIGCIGWSAQVFALQRLLEPALGAVAAALIALAIALGMSGAAAWVPLETNLVVACVLFAFACARDRRWRSAAIWAGFAVFLRPDAALPAALVLGACCWELRARALAPLALFGAIALPWPLFASAYYGSALPQTAITKFQRVGFLDYLAHEISHPSARLLWPVEGALGSALALGLVAAGALRLVRRDPRLGWFVAYGFLHAGAYLVLRPFLQHTWHLYPWTLVFCVCGSSALMPLPGTRSRLRWLQLAVTALLLISSGVRFQRECRVLASGYWTGQRDAAYREIASWLQAHAAPTDWFASIEVGTIAYYSGRSAFDLGGLVTRPDDSPSEHPVRYLVVDKAYLQNGPPSTPVFSARNGDFLANVYEPRPR